ncbi:DUF1223 domain-containing protein [Flavobacterium cupreum]|uniref:DUF1223 domain-containing protein n=1 Tax=Flavobacterium cupreum TaxID=2133766 RepID=A0A434A561_9FLAO|nr:DUF1223 domain-containing protein [Flavobacterium cupreum]RUT69486.1 DUF1223 domain-containing protein [Flavobacterium cupreum]
MENSINTTIKTLFIALIFIGLSSFALKKAIAPKEQNGFVVLELFTSQGCSSCPPADAILEKYAIQNNPNIIPLAFHIDYWDYIGWKDPYSKAEFSERQRNYAALFKSQNIYTPQLIINGKTQLTGSNESKINTVVNKELAIEKKNQITIKNATVSKDQLNIEYSITELSTQTNINIALVKKKEITNIKRGENSGLTQTNYNIVYDFKSNTPKSQFKNSASFHFKSGWLADDFMVIVYLQNKNTGEITGAAKTEIN